MSGYKSFALVGANSIGRYIIDGLIEKKVAGIISSVSVLSRSAEYHQDLVAKGVKVVSVDYSSTSSIRSVLADVDVLISTIGLSDKILLKFRRLLFRDGPAGGVWGEKYALKRRLKKELKLPYAAFYTGMFPDYVFDGDISKAMGFDFVDGVLRIPCSGTAAITWTHRVDIGRYVAHVLTTLPKDEIEWRTFRMEGERTNFNHIADDWKARAGRDVTTSHVPRSHFEDALAKNPADFLSQLILLLDSGNGVVGKVEEVTNDVFPEWKPKKVIDTLLELYV